MFDLFATMLAFFYSLVHNYAIAIALFTLVIMIALTPLTLKGTKGMLELQAIQPEMRRIQQEYKGDRQKMNEELMKLYSEHKVNPVGGCLPLLIQAPIFFILYRVLSGLTYTPSGGTGFEPKYLDKASEMYQSLVGQTEMLSFGLDLAKPATQVMQESFVKAIPYLILVLLVAVLSYIQQWQISARNSGSAMNSQQKILMRVLPAGFAVISLTLPSGIIFYFLVSNLYRIAQQFYITRRFYRDRPAPEPAPPPAKGTKGSAPSDAAPKPPTTSKRVTPPKSAATPKNRPRPPARPKPQPQPKKKT